ncbi:MAG: hypothetical protein ABIK43_05705, partial [candidate division WOR-3 bacterium]
VVAAVLIASMALAEAGTPRRGLAVLCSAVLPGSGQKLLGANVRGELMLWSDLAIWSVWGVNSWTAAERENDARLIAAARAGADLSITDRRYYRALELYDNSDEYNEAVRREARTRYPDDPVAQRQYYLLHGYFGDSVWNWSPDSARIREYWPKRKAARTSALAAGFAVGGLLLNRVVSVLDCAFFVHANGREGRVEVTPVTQPVGLEFRYRF